ncbi:DNA-directed RNA polymerase subunit D [Candidatus Woesearchaeota archaeon]|nr:DNA-directed RNA polymerase subunit D [Candidatus Woesearchaeota archaeon]
MEIRILEKAKDKMYLSFMIRGTTPAYANTLRRLMVGEVPTMAIEDVELFKNSSPMYDETVAHRLGLIPLTTDLKSYRMKKGPEDDGAAACETTLTLKAKGPCTVYASSLKAKDPKVVPAYPDMPICILLKGQELELQAVAILGKGRTHTKWSPGLVWYSYEPTLTINPKSDQLEKVKHLYPPQIFDKSGKIDKAAILDNNLVDAVDGVCDDVIKVEYNDKNIIFHVESWGQLDAKTIVQKAIELFDEQLDAFDASLKDLK